jgi:rare lipoprotein A
LRNSSLLPVLAAAVLAGACAHQRPVGWAPPVGTTAVGTASWYGPGFHGRRTSSGERFDQDALTAAHRRWAFGTRVRVTLLSTGRSVVVTINDRIPRKDRVIDVSRGAARALGLIRPGLGRVRLDVVREAPGRRPRVKRTSAGM